MQKRGVLVRGARHALRVQAVVVLALRVEVEVQVQVGVLLERAARWRRACGWFVRKESCFMVFVDLKTVRFVERRESWCPPRVSQGVN